MKLYEIAAGETIQIIARNENASVQYVAKVEFCEKKILFIEPIHYENKVVNFESDRIRNSIVYVKEGNKPIAWDGCVIKTLTYQKKRYQAIFSDRESKRYNRREAYRQYIGANGLLSIDATRKQMDVIVKDVSATGVAFVGEPTLSIEDIGAFHLNFEDAENRLNVQIVGKAVRDEQVDESKKVFGCVVKKSNINLNSYVVNKQNQEIARRHNKK